MSPGISLRMPKTMKVASTTTGTAWSRRRRITRRREAVSIGMSGRPRSARQRDELVLRLADEVRPVADDALRDRGHLGIEAERDHQRLLHHDALDPREDLLAHGRVLALAALREQLGELRRDLDAPGIEVRVLPVHQPVGHRGVRPAGPGGDEGVELLLLAEVLRADFGNRPVGELEAD